VRELIRRFRICEAGAGAVEYALLLAVLAFGLMGVLAIFRNAVGGLTNRTAVSVSTEAGGGYGTGRSVGGGSIGGIVSHGPSPSDPDSSSVEPDSSSATGGSTAAMLDPAMP
jgi:Flp pilus assembly pilin Flp